MGAAMAALLLGSFTGCAQSLAKLPLEEFDKAYDESLVVWTTDLPPAGAGQAYAFNLQARGKPKPFRWRMVSGQLPDGMELNDDGQIQGTSSAPGVATFVAKVACRSQPQTSAQGLSPHVDWRMRQFTLVVRSRP